MTNDAKMRLPDGAPSEAATATWLAVVQTYNECTATLSQRLVPLGLSLLEHEVLMNLLRSPDLTQRQLSERCFSAKSGISMLISRFEADGLIRRRRSATDQRAWLLALTAQGQALANEALLVQQQIVEAMAEAFSQQELLLVKTRMEAAATRLQQLREDKAG